VITFVHPGLINCVDDLNGPRALLIQGALRTRFRRALIMAHHEFNYAERLLLDIQAPRNSKQCIWNNNVAWGLQVLFIFPVEF
jgi:hypothetical protein